MTIPESQLKTWANPGANKTAKVTADSVKNALNSNIPQDLDFEVYLQGSYRNSTNIRGDSDVDIVAQLNSAFQSNLSEHQQEILGLIPTTYRWSDFKVCVWTALKNYYRQSEITEGNKTLKLQKGSGMLPADIVVCLQYRQYKTVNKDNYIEGVCFWTKNEHKMIVNFPKIHYQNGVTKNGSTNEWFKHIVRMFKNMKGCVSNDATPSSYLIECLIYNVPDSNFGMSYQNSFFNIISWLNKADLDIFVSEDGQEKLFKTPAEKIQTENFIKNVIALWNNW